MHTNVEFNLLTHQVMKDSPIVSDSPLRNQISDYHKNRSSSPNDKQIKFWGSLFPLFHQSDFFFISLFFLQEMSTEKVTKGHQKVFQDEWLNNAQFKPWLSRVKNKKHKFRCNICQKVLELSTPGHSALSDHAKEKKHLPAWRRGIVSSKMPKWEKSPLRLTKFCKQCESSWTTNSGRMYR